ncbi:MAG: cyclic nucleotide-binding domain-containing protein [Deltaproteobacteria bacterium]|nr:cyclic nucleotide-binding domain-containing protein [Deltaproteobacteria bacterium]
MSEPGELYGKYQLLSLIAYGGMAEVWLARSSSIGGFEKFLAIKRMHSSLSQNPDFVTMFIEEAKLSVALSHPNIVQVFDFGRVDDNYFIAMEYVDGLDLATISFRAREETRRFPIEAATYVMLRTFEGLAYAHSPRGHRTKAIIHRDVSPQNVLVSLDGQVKLSDFGIAQATESFQIEGAGQVVGKVAYMSPEQARGDALTTATDVWAAGVILHELITRQRLFAKESEEDTLRAVAHDPVPRPSEINPEVPPELDALVLSILDRDPYGRPATREVAEALAEILRARWPRMSDLALERIVADLRTEPGSESSGPHRTRAAITAEITDNFETDTTAVGGIVEPTDEVGPPEPVVDAAIVIDALKDQFEREPNLWLLVDIGEIYFQSGDLDRARFVLMLAAGKFAQRGLLVQAVSIAGRLIELQPDAESTRRTIQNLQALAGGTDDELVRHLFDSDDDAMVEEYRGLLDAANQRAPTGGILPKTPILSTITPEQLTRLVYALRRREVSAGEVIMQEGDPGHAFYWIGRGRVVISGHNFEGKRVYLTSLTDGDCFGEQGFFTGEPRNATVEATEPVILVEVEKSALDDLALELPGLRAGLLEFYKERLAESLLARSPLFGHIPVRARRSLAEKFSFTIADTNEVILHQGEESTCFYAVKAGRVQVFTEKQGEEVKLSVLGAGEVFGEIAALRGTRRNASVRALEPCELLKLESTDLRRFLAQNAEIKKKIEQQVNDRIADTTRKIMIPS